MAKKKSKRKNKKNFKNVKRTLTIVFGTGLTVGFLFLAVYAVDFFARQASQKGPTKPMPFAARGQSSDSTAGIQQEKISLQSYPTFFETLSQKGQTKVRADRLREKKLLSIKRSGRKNSAAPVKLIKSDDGKTSPSGAARPDSRTDYKIQLGSFRHSEKARAFAENMAEKGYEPYILEVKVRGQGTVFRVRLGRFKELEEAQKVAEKLEKKEKLSVLITSK